MTGYVKSISKRNEGDDKEKTLPIAHLGSSMISHGEDFDAHSEYGRCLISTFFTMFAPEALSLHVFLTMTTIAFGRTEERLARVQESYIAQSNSSWLESLERALTQLKDYQVWLASISRSDLKYLTCTLVCSEEA